MRKVNLVLIFAAIVASLLIYSCQKDEMSSLHKDDLQSKIFIDTLLVSDDSSIESEVSEYEGLRDEEMIVIKKIANKRILKIRSSVLFSQADLDFDKVVKHYQGSHYSTFAIPIQADIPYKFYNLIYNIDTTYNLLDEYVMEYSMHPDFYEGYIRGYFDMTDFEGKFRKASLEEFFAVSKSIECEEQPCCPIDPTGGGPTPNPSPTPSQPPANPGAPTIIVPINPPNGGGGGVDGSGTLDFIDYDTDCPWVLFCIDCTCINKCHPKTCDCGDARPNNTNFIKSRWVLANPCPDPFTSDDLLTKTSGDCCPSDNDEIPVAPPIDSGTVGDEEDGDNSATPISIICHNSLYNYAATLGVSGNSVAVGNLQGIFSCYPDDCQSSCYNYDENGTNSQVQFEACISTVINDHFADCTQWPSKFDDYEDKFGYEFTEQEKAQILTKSGGCGEDTSFDDEVINTLIIAIDDTYPSLNLDELQKAILKSKPKIIGDLFDLSKNPSLDNETKQTTADLVLDLLRDNPLFLELYDEWPQIPAFVWPFLKDVGAELGSELFKALAKKYSPVGQVEEVIDAIKALSQGDLMEFCANVISIVKKKFPAGVIFDAGIEAKELFERANPVWKAISRMEKFGGEAIDKLLQTIKGTGGNILDKFKWKGGNIGAELLDVGDPLDFWDGLVDLFPNRVLKQGSPGANDIVFEIPPTNWELRFYIDANTNSRTTIQFKTPQGFKFKIRF